MTTSVTQIPGYVAGTWDIDPVHSQALLTRLRTWIDAHTDQVIIAGSLILGLWLIGYTIYLVVT